MYHLDQNNRAVGFLGPAGGNSGWYSPSNMSMSVQLGGGTCRRISPWLIGFLMLRLSITSVSRYGLLSLYVLQTTWCFTSQLSVLLPDLINKCYSR